MTGLLFRMPSDEEIAEISAKHLIKTPLKWPFRTEARKQKSKEWGEL
jgi:hypothetical protein